MSKDADFEQGSKPVALKQCHGQVAWVHMWCGHPSHTIVSRTQPYPNSYIICNRRINPNENWIDDHPVMWAHSNPENDAEMVTLTPNFWHITPKTRTPYTKPQTHERQTPDPKPGISVPLTFQWARSHFIVRYIYLAETIKFTQLCSPTQTKSARNQLEIP